MPEDDAATDSVLVALMGQVKVQVQGPVQAGDYLITGPGWQGTVPADMTQITAPDNSVLVLGRILVYSDSDLSTAYALAEQIQLKPLS